MKILFHVGVGNLDRPYRWYFVNGLYSKLAMTLEELGHECLVWTHTKALKSKYNNNIMSQSITGNELLKAKEFKPNWVFTWNGASEGDKIIENVFGKGRTVYGELGFFNHYNTLYFDFNGVNSKSENLTEELLPFDEEIYKKLKTQFIKPSLYYGKFIFVALQDEKDTNITMYSPVKTMDEVLQYVQDNIKINNDVKVLYKQHPKAPCKITPRPNFIEVKENVHHYLPYAEQVVGVNSTVLLEALIYNNNVITLGEGITSRIFKGEEHKQYITHVFQKQFNMDDMGNVELIKNSKFYKKLCQIV